MLINGKTMQVKSLFQTHFIGLSLPLLGLLLTVGQGYAATPQIITVAASAASEGSTISGTVIPFKEITLTAQMPGRIDRVAGNEGDAFKLGQEL